MLNLRFRMYFTKINQFLWHSVYQFCLQYKTIQRFRKTWHALNFNFILIMKFTNAAGFLKNVFKRKVRAHLKKKN